MPSSGGIGAGTGMPPSGMPLRSASVSEVNDRRRRAVARQRRRHGRLRIVLIVLLVLVVAAGIGLFALSKSDVFKVEEVTVSGVEHLTAEEMQSLADIPSSTTLLNVDAAGIESRLLSNAWVSSAQVERVFPNKLNLNITERTISAVVEVKVDDSATTETWALSSDGMWLMKIPDRDSEEAASIASKVFDDADAALRITDVPYGSTPEAGTMCENASISNALSIIDGMSTELAEQVKYVAASNSESTTITLENGVEVAFGDSEDIHDKERVILELLSEHEGQISYINVRDVNNPIWRSL